MEPPLRDLVVTLGKQLVARNLPRHANSVRVYLLALDRGLLDDRRKLDVSCSPAFIREWLGMLRLPPYETMFPVHPNDVVGCPQCHEHSVHTEVSVLDFSRRACSKCKFRWLTVHGG